MPMAWLLDLLYLFALILLSPWLVYKAFTTGKYRRGLWHKLIGPSRFTPSRQHPTTPSPRCPTDWFHGVSVGEIHLLRQVVACFRERHPDWDCVISTTTDTGFAEALKCFPGLPIFYWPFDFSWAVRRSFRRINPALVILAEVELWPNFLIAAKSRDVSVAVINADRKSTRLNSSHT